MSQKLSIAEIIESNDPVKDATALERMPAIRQAIAGVRRSRTAEEQRAQLLELQMQQVAEGLHRLKSEIAETTLEITILNTMLSKRKKMLKNAQALYEKAQKFEHSLVDTAQNTLPELLLEQLAPPTPEQVAIDITADLDFHEM